MKSNNITTPRFSIIIPTYNTEFVLDECLKALCIQSQKKAAFEVIVVNDGGNDKTKEIVQKYNNKISIQYLYQENNGPAAARNFGIKNSKGEIILFIDDDSLPTHNWFESTVDAWNKYPDYDGIGGYTTYDMDESIYCRVNSNFFNWYLRQYADDQQHPFLVTCNAGYKKSVLEKVNYFDESYKRASGEDRDLNIKIARIGGKLRLDKNILVYHDRDLTFKSNTKKHYYYGKAAYNIYTRYPELARLDRSAYIDLYVSVLKKYHTFREKILAVFLITLSQACTFAGYHIARFYSKEK